MVADQSEDPAARNAKQAGVTEAERYLASLCERSFLSLWSYPAVFRDQGKSGGGDGKEVADHLVVFENDIVIFSDKDIAWPSAAPHDTAWKRWYKRAVRAGAQQLWGAERWIRQFPNRLFLDRACTVPFPVALPDSSQTRFHLVLVAHGSADACRDWHGGSGSLMLSNSPAVGDSMPFTVGDIDSSRSFIHILDDTTLDVVMKHCDTISDFTAYLARKERLFRSRTRVMAAGEEELLARYLVNVDDTGLHSFSIPPDITDVYFDEGSYIEYLRNPQYRAKARADAPSYGWDKLIETFSTHVVNDTLSFKSGTGISHHEPGLRLLAREPRVRRRQLVKSILDLAATKHGDPNRRVRVGSPTSPGDPYYVFLLLRHPAEKPYEEYREVRRNLLLHYCRTVCLIDPSARKVLGLAMDFPETQPSSEDMLLIDGADLTPADREEAERVRHELNLLNEVRQFRTSESEYPKPASDGTTVFHGSLHRNAPCPCGSGRKYRLCCRRPSPFHRR